MYYEEQIFNGLYYCRYTPNGVWRELTNKELTDKIKTLKLEIKKLKFKSNESIKS